MQTRNRIFDDIAKVANSAAGTFAGLKGEVEGLGEPLTRIADTFEMLAEAECNKRLDRFHWQENGTVIDSCSPLMWVDHNIHLPGQDRWNFDGANEFVNNLEYAGYSDWRMPTTSELVSLINTSGQSFFGSTKNMPQFMITARLGVPTPDESLKVLSSYVGPGDQALSVNFRTGTDHMYIEDMSGCPGGPGGCLMYQSVIPVRDITPEE